MMKIKIEIPSGLQGSCYRPNDLEQIGFPAKVVDRTPFGGNTIDRLRQAKTAHVRLHYGEIHTFLPRLFTSEATHFRGKVEGIDLQAAPGEFNRVGSCATTEFADRPGVSQDGGQEAAASQLPGI